MTSSKNSGWHKYQVRSYTNQAPDVVFNDDAHQVVRCSPRTYTSESDAQQEADRFEKSGIPHDDWAIVDKM